MLTVKLVFPDQYQAGSVSTQDMTSGTMARKYNSEPYLSRQKHRLAFLVLFA